MENAPGFKTPMELQKERQKEAKKREKEANRDRPNRKYPWIMDKNMKDQQQLAKAWPKSMSAKERKRIIEHAKRARRLGQLEAGAAVWGPIEGIGNPGKSFVLSRYEVMEYIIDMVSQGHSLPSIVQWHIDECPFPTVAEIRTWCKMHPDFERELLEADRSRGEHLGELALDVVMEAPDEEDPRKTKLKHEALSKHAARLNQRYQDKQVQQVEDVTANMTREDLLNRLKSLASKHKEVETLAFGVGVEDVPGSDHVSGCGMETGEAEGAEE